MCKSETSGVRNILARYCVGDGVDVGYGGDPITPSAICFDLCNPYTEVGEYPQHLRGSAADLPFKDGRLDYVYSSHLIEDFTYEAQCILIHEWARVLKDGGLIVLCAPDQRRYRAHCEKTGQPLNLAHVNDFYSLKYFKEDVLSKIVSYPLYVIMERDNIGNNKYSWCIVLEKRKA